VVALPSVPLYTARFRAPKPLSSTNLEVPRWQFSGKLPVREQTGYKRTFAPLYQVPTSSKTTHYLRREHRPLREGSTPRSSRTGRSHLRATWLPRRTHSPLEKRSRSLHRRLGHENSAQSGARGPTTTAGSACELRQWSLVSGHGRASVSSAATMEGPNSLRRACSILPIASEPADTQLEHG
jgi:hypothetical protein